MAMACAASQAQTTPASPAKKELVAKILKIQQPGMEAMARELTRQPANELVSSAMEFLQTVPADKREALAKGIQQDADKYMNDTFPIVRDQAFKLAQPTVGVLLEEKFSEDELRQMVAILENPVYGKFQSLGGEMQRSLVSKLVPELKPMVSPKVRALDESIAKRLGVPSMGAQISSAAAARGAASAPAPAAAAKPAPKK